MLWVADDEDDNNDDDDEYVNLVMLFGDHGNFDDDGDDDNDEDEQEPFVYLLTVRVKVAPSCSNLGFQRISHWEVRGFKNVILNMYFSDREVWRVHWTCTWQ